MKRAYLDSSAFVKLVVAEPESTALRQWMRRRAWTSSALLTAEALRAVRPHGGNAMLRARTMIAQGSLIRLTPALLAGSAEAGSPELRTLDAIHLISASALGDQLSAVVTYDPRLAHAAGQMGMRVVAPA